MSVRGQSWRDSAECRTHPPELWFASAGTAGGRDELRLARAVCESCQVRNECLAWSLTTRPLVQGVWGGLDDDERLRMRHELRARRVPRELVGWEVASGER